MWTREVIKCSLVSHCFNNSDCKARVEWFLTCFSWYILKMTWLVAELFTNERSSSVFNLVLVMKMLCLLKILNDRRNKLRNKLISMKKVIRKNLRNS